MSTENLPLTMVETVAARLEDDILRRGLRSGDRYMTAAEASQWLEASPVTVNRAMQLLADRDLLVRRRSRGTFVGPSFQAGSDNAAAVDVVHLLMAMDYHSTRTVSSDKLVDAVTANQPGALVEIHYLPDETAVAGTRRITERIASSDLREGMILIRSLRESQLLVQQAGVPAVIYGQVYPGVELPCVKQDQAAIGRALAGFAVRNGHTRFALLTHNRWRHGDNLMIEALTQSLAQAGVGLDSVLIRSMTPDRCVVTECIRSLLDRRQAATALLCRNDYYATLAEEALAQLRGDLAVAEVDIASGGHSPPEGATSFARVVSDWSLEKQMQFLIAQLVDASEHRPGSTEQVTVPARFYEAGQTCQAISD